METVADDARLAWRRVLQHHSLADDALPGLKALAHAELGLKAKEALRRGYSAATACGGVAGS